MILNNNITTKLNISNITKTSNINQILPQNIKEITKNILEGIARLCNSTLYIG